MPIQTIEVTDKQLLEILAYKEGHFLDLKAKEIGPGKLSKAISAFANVLAETGYAPVPAVPNRKPASSKGSRSDC